MLLFAESQDKKKKISIKCFMLNKAFRTSCKYKDLGLLESDSGWSSRVLPAFRRNKLPPYLQFKLPSKDW